MIRDRVLYELTPALLQAIDADGHILAVSNQWLETTGYARETVIGQPWQQFLTPAAQASPSAQFSSECWHTGQVRDRLLHLVRQDGTLMAVRLSANLVHDAEERPAYWLAVLTDLEVSDRTAALTEANQRLQQEIRDRQRGEAELRASHALHQSIIEDQADLIYRMRPDGTLTFVNRAFCEFFQQPARALLGHPFLLPTPGANPSPLLQALEQISQGQPESTRAYCIYDRMGEIRWHQWTHRGLFNAQGELVELQCAGRDITDLKRIETALEESRQLMQMAFDHMPQRIFWKDTTSRFMGCNQAFARDWGLSSPASVIGKTDYDLPLPAAIAHAFVESDRAVLATGQAVLAQVEHAADWEHPSPQWIRASKLPLKNTNGDIVGVFGTYEDITAEKQAQVSLQRYVRMVQAATDGICLLDRDYRYQVANQTYLDWYGHAGQPILGQTVAQVLGQAAFDQRLKSLLDQCLAGETIRYAAWFTFPQLGRRYRSVTCAPYVEPDGAITGIVTSIRDLTALKQSERRQQELLEIIEATTDLIGMATPDGEVLHLNPAFEQLYTSLDGCSQAPDRIEGYYPAAVLPRLHNEIVKTAIERGTWQGENTLLLPDGTVMPVSQTVTAHVDEQGKVKLLSTILRDISAQKQLEQQLRDRLQFQQLLSRISTHFVNLPSHALAAGLQQALGEIVQAAGAERGYGYVFSADYQQGHLYCQWQAPHLAPLAPEWETIPAAPFQWWMSHLHQRQAIAITSLEELPPQAAAERAAIESADTRSLVVVPMYHSQRLMGYIGFSTVTREKIWQPDEVALLRLVGDLFANAYRRQQDDITLRHQEHYFRALTENASDIVVLLDAEYRFQYATPSVTHILGYTPEALIGQLALDFVAPEDVDRAILMLRRAAAMPRQPFTLTYRTRHREGTWRYFEAIITSLLEDDWVQGIVVNCRNVSDRVQAEIAQRQSDLRFQAFFEQSAISMTQLALDGTYLRVNPAFCQLVGYPATELIGVHFSKVTHPDDLARDQQVIEAIATGCIPARLLEKRFVSTDGDIRHVQVVLTAVGAASEPPAFVAAVYNDITERVMAETALHSLVEGTAAVVGEDFFMALARQLAHSLAVDHIVISEFDGWAMHSLVYWSQGEVQPNFDYPIFQTPCAQTVEQGFYSCPAGLRAAFPGSPELGVFQAEAYLGVALLGSQGNVLGGICAVHSQPMRNPENAAKLLRILAARASAELERQHADRALKESEARFQRLAANMPGVIYRYSQGPDGSDRFTYVSPGSQALWELSPAAVYADANRVWALLPPDAVAGFRTSIQRAIAEQTQWFLEHRIITPSGRQKWVQGVARPEAQPDGGYVWDGVLIDVTARKCAEDALLESQARFERLASNMPGMIYRYHVHLDGHEAFSYISPACQEIWEIEPAAVLADAQLAWNLVHPDDIQHLQQVVAEVRQRQAPLSVDYRIITASDRLKWLQVLARPAPQPDGSCLWDGIMIDITPQKEAEQALRMSEALNRAILEAMPDLLIRMRRDGLCLDMRYPPHFNVVCPRDRHVGRKIQDTLPAHIAAERLAATERALDTGETQLYEYRTPVGDRLLWEEARVVPLNADEVIVMVRDIDDRKQAEAALQQSNALNRAIIGALPDMLLRVRIDGFCIDAQCPSTFPALIPVEATIGRNIQEVLPTDLAAQLLTLAQSVLQTQAPQVTEYLLAVNDQAHWEESRIVPLNADEVLVLIRDIDERRQAETEVRRLNAVLESQNQQLEALVEQRTAELITFMNALPDQIFVVDRATGRMPFGNDGVVKFAKRLNRQAFEGNTVFDCFAPEQAARYAEQNRQVFETGEVLHLEESIATPEGRLYLDTYKIPLKQANGEVYALIGTSRDVTELVRVRQALEAQAAQLAATNRELQAFSYSVSHDLRAPLRHINGFISALKYQLGAAVAADPKVAHYLNVIESSSHKMGLLIDGLLTLSRVGRQEVALRPVQLMTLVHQALNLLNLTQTDPKTRQITIEALPLVKGDATLLQQVFTNLLDNAAKFSRDRQPAQIYIGQRAEDGAIFIRDNGVGFDMAYADKLFSPFQRLHGQTEFTGTGIGLAIVQRIIHRHGGQIWVESALNQGTTFFFTLPQ